MECRQDVQIDVAPEVAWAAIIDVAAWPSWTPTMSSIAALDPGPLGLGARYEVAQPRLPRLEWVVTELTPGFHFTWEARTLGLRTVAEHRVEARRTSSCTVTLVLRQTGALAGLVGLFSGRRTERMVATEASSLKAYLEAR